MLFAKQITGDETEMSKMGLEKLALNSWVDIKSEEVRIVD